MKHFIYKYQDPFGALLPAGSYGVKDYTKSDFWKSNFDPNNDEFAIYNKLKIPVDNYLKEVVVTPDNVDVSGILKLNNIADSEYQDLKSKLGYEPSQEDYQLYNIIKKQRSNGVNRTPLEAADILSQTRQMQGKIRLATSAAAKPLLSLYALPLCSLLAPAVTAAGATWEAFTVAHPILGGTLGTLGTGAMTGLGAKATVDDFSEAADYYKKWQQTNNPYYFDQMMESGLWGVFDGTLTGVTGYGAAKSAYNTAKAIDAAVTNTRKAYQISKAIDAAVDATELPVETPKLNVGWSPAEDMDVYHASNKYIYDFDETTPFRYDALRGAPANVTWTAEGDKAASGFLKERPWNYRLRFSPKKPMVQVGEIEVPEGMKNTSRGDLLRLADASGADAYILKDVADNEMEHQTVIASFNPDGNIGPRRGPLKGTGSGKINLSNVSEADAWIPETADGNVDMAKVVDMARNGDTRALELLGKWGLPYKNKHTYRYIGNEEFESLRGNNHIDGRRGIDAVDVTSSETPSTGASSDFRVRFKPVHDMDVHMPGNRARMKNPELGDGWLLGGYDMNDVDVIERFNPRTGAYEPVYRDGEWLSGGTDAMSDSEFHNYMMKQINSQTGLTVEANFKKRMQTSKHNSPYMEPVESTRDYNEKLIKKIEDELRAENPNITEQEIEDYFVLKLGNSRFDVRNADGFVYRDSSGKVHAASYGEGFDDYHTMITKTHEWNHTGYDFGPSGDLSNYNVFGMDAFNDPRNCTHLFFTEDSGFRAPNFDSPIVDLDTEMYMDADETSSFSTELLGLLGKQDHTLTGRELKWLVDHKNIVFAKLGHKREFNTIFGRIINFDKAAETINKCATGLVVGSVAGTAAVAASKKYKGGKLNKIYIGNNS